MIRIRSPKILMSFVIIVFFGLLLLFLQRIELVSDKWFRIISIVGTLASAFGLLMVIIQIVGLKSISQFTKETAENTREQVISFLHASDISKTIKIIQEIQNYNRMKKFELSIIRMQELKYSLMQIKNNSKFEEMIKVKDYSNHITDLSVNISSLEKELQRQSNSLNIISLNGFLEKVLNDLIDLDTIVKQLGAKI